MKYQIRDFILVALLVVICPLLATMHGVALAAEGGTDAAASEAQLERDNQNKLNLPLPVDIKEMLRHLGNLSDEDKQAVKQELSAGLGEALGSDGEWNEEIIIPLAGMVFSAFVVSIPVLIVALVLIFSNRKRKQRIALINKFVENGQEVPKELLVEHEDRDTTGPDSNMKRGITLMGVGIGIFIAVGVLASWKIGAVGMIPFFIGLARVIIWKLEVKESKKVVDETLAE